jgi:hypothetical protein
MMKPQQIDVGTGLQIRKQGTNRLIVLAYGIATSLGAFETNSKRVSLMKIGWSPIFSDSLRGSKKPCRSNDLQGFLLFFSFTMENYFFQSFDISSSDLPLVSGTNFHIKKAASNPIAP